jgi:hypothetical protein
MVVAETEVRMKLWRLQPKGKHRSANWKRSIYDGEMGAVIVRAQSEFEARAVAAEEFEPEEAPVSGDVLRSPWMHEEDTIIEPCADKHDSLDGAAEVLRPTRATVTGP